MKKNIIKTSIISTLLLSLSIPVFASIGDSGWYSSTITLPRTGSWTTTARKATASNQEVQVKGNNYAVHSRIITNSGTTLTKYKTHKAGDNTELTHSSGTTKGDTIRAEFKTGATNYKITKCTLGWRP